MMWTLVRAAIGFGIAFYVLHPHDVGAWLRAHAPTPLWQQTCQANTTPNTPQTRATGTAPACPGLTAGTGTDIPLVSGLIEHLRQIAR